MHDYSWMNYDQMMALAKPRARVLRTPLPKDRQALIQTIKDALQGHDTPFIFGASVDDLRGIVARSKIAETTYEFTPAPEELSRSSDGDLIGGWINGKITLKDGRTFAAGGGWVDIVGLVQSYNYRDAGDVDNLANALDLYVDETMEILCADCPTEYTV